MIDLKKKDTMYKEYKISKGNGKYRLVQEPFPELKEEQSKIAKELSAIKISNCAFGFAENRDIFKNAKRHLGSKYILEMDLKSFFDTITEDHVYQALVNNRVDKERAEYISKVCTRFGVTPQGSPSSPILSNIVCKPLDRKIKTLCIKNQVTYTRYADDLTFSSQSEDGFNLLQDIKKEVQSIVNKYDFSINGSKTRTVTKGRRQSVTGVVVNEKMNSPRKETRVFRAKLHNILIDIKNGDLTSLGDLKYKYESINQLSGYANFLYQANPDKNSKYLNQVKKIRSKLREESHG